MKRHATTRGGAWGFVVLGLLFSAALPTTEAWAQTPTARSFGVAVFTPTASTTSPLAVLPTDGSMSDASAPNVSVANFVGADNVFATATGSAGSAESNATLENVSLLNGLITANGVMALASSALTGSAAISDAAGSLLDNLVVNGASIASDVLPNTRIDLPGLGYVVLNEQTLTGDGVSSSGITVNMIHVVLVDALTGAQTGEIVVGSASSSVN